MKKGIHPKYNDKIDVTCANCGAKFTFGAVVDSINIEMCSKCHPAYTGKQTIVDTAGMVEKFKARQAQAKVAAKNKKETQEEVSAVA